MQIKVNGETPFQILAPAFCIAATSAGYTLNYSADGVTYTPWAEATSQDVNQPVINSVPGMYYFLENNADDNVVIIY